VTVQAEVDLVGKIVQFGRGMIEEVSRQLFRQFAACAKQQLESADSNPGPVEATESAAQSPVEPKSVSAVPLALRALWTLIVRSMKSLFGKQAN
jgi:uncharacterized protein